MTFLPQLSLKIRLLVCVSVSLLILAGALTYKAALRLDQASAERMEQANDTAVLSMVHELRADFSDLTLTPSPPGTIAQIRWDNMPTELAAGSLDAVREMTGLHVAVFRLDQAAEAFPAIAATVDVEGNPEEEAMRIGSGPLYDAMLAGVPYNGTASFLDVAYSGQYYPVQDSAGNTVGVFASGYAMSSLTAYTQDAMWRSLLITLVVVALALIGAFIYVSNALKPLDEVTRSIVSLSNGSVRETIPYTTRNDEIGQISQSLVVLQSSMQHAEDLQEEDAERRRLAREKHAEQESVVDALSDGLAKLGQLDLTARIDSVNGQPFPAEYDSLRVSFNTLVDRLSETIEAIRTVADEVNRDAREMAASSIDLSSRTEHQAATLQESAAALEELSQSVQSTAENASDAESTTDANRQVAKKTGEIVEDAVTAMAAIEASSQQITQIISVIDDIAFQTNLLALNAGVEAARAGEAGRGFAVVASEVRALAQHSSASAQEIKALIAASSEQVETGSKLVRETGQSLGDIIDRVERVAGLVSDIAVSAKEQSVGVGEINAGVRDLDAATQRNAAMAEEASATNEGLTNAADRLASHLARFQVLKTAKPVNWAAVATGEASADPSTAHHPSGALGEAQTFGSDATNGAYTPVPVPNTFRGF